MVDWNFSFAFLGWVWFLTGVGLFATWALRYHTTDKEYRGFQLASIAFCFAGAICLAMVTIGGMR